MNTVNGGTPERQEIESLLPWHAAGTLSRRDAQRVEDALASDRELARHYDVVREELNETIHLNESLGAPSARAMERLFAAIDAEGAKAPSRTSFDFAGRVAEFLSSLAPRTLAWSASAAAVAIMLQAAVLTSVVVNEQTGTQGTELASAPTSDGMLAVIRFAPQANAAEITNFLDAYKVVMVDGPKKGLYTIRFTTPGMPKADVFKSVQRMQTESKIVEFIASKE
jgi:anti-sigma-K factor RskA